MSEIQNKFRFFYYTHIHIHLQIYTIKGASNEAPFLYMFTQLDAPNAVNTAVITDAKI